MKEMYAPSQEAYAEFCENIEARRQHDLLKDEDGRTVFVPAGYGEEAAEARGLRPRINWGRASSRSGFLNDNAAWRWSVSRLADGHWVWQASADDLVVGGSTAATADAAEYLAKECLKRHRERRMA